MMITFIAALCVMSLDSTRYTTCPQTYRHLGIENTTDEIWPMLYLTYSGVCSDGEASFCNFKVLTKLYQSLEAEIGLVPDYQDRGNRAEHGAIQMWKSWKILLQVDNRRKNNTLKTPATECACKGILSSLLMCPTSWKIIVFNCAKFLK